jgi:hypothetical protein
MSGGPGSKAAQAEEVIGRKMSERGIPPSHWYIARDPIRLVYLHDGQVGKDRLELRLDRRWKDKRLEEWLDKYVGYEVDDSILDDVLD